MIQVVTCECCGGHGVLPIETLILDRARVAVIWHAHVIPISLAEFNILEALARRPGVVKTRNDLMDVAQGEYSEACDRSIDAHMKRIRAKLRVANSNVDPIVGVYGLGYRLADHVRIAEWIQPSEDAPVAQMTFSPGSKPHQQKISSSGEGPVNGGFPSVSDSRRIVGPGMQESAR